MQDVSYAFGKTLPGATYAEAVSRVEEALQQQGLGILMWSPMSWNYYWKERR